MQEKVPEVIYSFWTGSNEITPIRQEIIDKCKTVLGVPHILVTKKNLHKYILPEHPLHEGYKYLSRMHRGDYLRTYFMHFHGGGYHDLKYPLKSWKSAFDKINNDKNIWCVGISTYENNNDPYFRLVYPDNISQTEKSRLHELYDKRILVGFSFFIYRANTQLTQEWYNNMLKFLDNKLEQLKKHPAKYTRESFDREPSYWCRDETDPNIKKLPCPKEPTKYPIYWSNFICLNYPVQSKYIDHVTHGIPQASTAKYDNFTGGFLLKYNLIKIEEGELTDTQLYKFNEYQLKKIYGKNVINKGFDKTFLHLYKLIYHLNDLSNIYKFRYVLHAGTLLGCIRHNSIIPYDNDTDIIIGKSDADILLNIANDSDIPWCIYSNQIQNNIFNKYKYVLIIHELESCSRYDCNGNHINYQIDACAFNGPFARLIMMYDNNLIYCDIFIYTTDMKPYATYKESVDLPQNLIQKELFNIKTYVLEDYEKYLIKKYGENYLVPNKRFN
jgi:hypothetical protein